MKISEAKVLQLHGMGPKAIGQLRHALADKGLSFVQASWAHVFNKGKKL